MKEILTSLNLDVKFNNPVNYASILASKSSSKLVLWYATSSIFSSESRSNKIPHRMNTDQFLKLFRSKRIRKRITDITSELDSQGIDYVFQVHNGNSVKGLINECNRGDYELLILGTYFNGRVWGYIQDTYISKLISEVNKPVFVVPQDMRYNHIEHITYAADLTDYDPNVILQLKSIASLFDAKLSIVHVNAEEEGKADEYVSYLEKTISDTLDYPKIYYKFFDDIDPLSGIKRFVHQNNANMLAMINRKKLSWKDLLKKGSLIRHISQDLQIPLLSFSQKKVNINYESGYLNPSGG